MFTRLSRSTIKNQMLRFENARVGEPSTSGLLLHYTGGVSGGNPVLEYGSTNGTGGSITGSTDAGGKYIGFDGVTSYSYIDTNIGANVAYSAATVSCWINPSSTNTTSGQGTICSNSSYFASSYTDFPFSLKWTYATALVGAVFSYGNDYSYDLVISSSSAPTGTWTHVACSYASPGTAKLYLNGALVASGSLTSALSTSTRNWFFGRAAYPNGGGAPGDPFNGGIDEMRLYSRQLSDSEIASIYLCGR